MKKYLVGKRISLHGLIEQDTGPESPYYSWLDDLSLDTFTERSVFPNSEKRMTDYFKRAQSDNTLVLLGIFDNDNGCHIGNITFQEINWIRRRAVMGYMIGDKSYAGKGYATEAVMMMMYYGFLKLNLERIQANVSEKHLASRRVCEKAGLMEEGKLREYFFNNNEAVGLVLYGALKREWLSDYADKALGFYDGQPF